MLDALVSKEVQLDLFLNLAYFGHENNREIKGLSQAAQVYYKKELNALTEPEFIGLVALLIGPNKFKPATIFHVEKVERIQAYLSGDYQPKSLLDTQYDNTTSGNFSEKLIVAFLRLITKPTF